MGTCQSNTSLVAQPLNRKNRVPLAEVKDLITPQECKEMLRNCGEMSPDTAPGENVSRTKRICYVQFINDLLFKGDIDYFI